MTVYAAALIGMAACNAADTNDLSAPRSTDVGVTGDLVMGSTGAEVTALHEYLARSGYFPNSSLQRQFPAWRPIVSTPPSQAAVFDANTAAAIRALQQNAGLTETGIVDQATRALLQQPRCGVPDGIAKHDPTEKWDLTNNGRWSKTNLTWSLDNTDNNKIGRREDIEAAITDALASWQAPSGYTFTKFSGGILTDIHIGFASLAAGTNASTTDIANGGDVTLNQKRPWVVGTRNSVLPGQMSMDSVLIHELGHALGLAHSPYSDAIMYPFVDYGWQSKTDLTVDDTTSILQMQSRFIAFDSEDHDIAYSRHPSGSERLWVVGGTATNGNYPIWDLQNKSSWTLHPGAAVRIAVNPLPSGPTPPAPWVVNARGRIFQFNWTTGDWDNLVTDVCATDIAVGEDGSVWIVGCDSVPGGHSIYKLTSPILSLTDGFLNCTQPCFTAIPGGAVRIAVGPVSHEDSSNVPWVTNASNDIFRRNPATGAFVQLPGKGTDIAAAGGIAWSISPPTANTFNTFCNMQVWDEQDPKDVGGSPPPVARKEWLVFRFLAAGATAISVADGRPVVIDNGFNAYWTQDQP